MIINDVEVIDFDSGIPSRYTFELLNQGTLDNFIAY
jgi:hypothetical protein